MLERPTSFERHAASNGLQVQTVGKVGTTDRAHEVRVAAHHELVTGAGQPDVETFAGALES